MVSPMCHHLDYTAWESLEEEALEPEPSEPTDEAEPELPEEPEKREPAVPLADD